MPTGTAPAAGSVMASFKVSPCETSTGRRVGARPGASEELAGTIALAPHARTGRERELEVRVGGELRLAPAVVVGREPARELVGEVACAIALGA